MSCGKKFLVIGNGNAVIYKEVFPLIKENKIWLGVSPRSMGFILPNGEKGAVNTWWYTNIEHNKRHEPLDLYKKYSAEEYPMFDESDVINVNKVADIPMDYNGVMGVPISFLDKYCPDQFEIVGLYCSGSRITQKDEDWWKDPSRCVTNKYARILIRRK